MKKYFLFIFILLFSGNNFFALEQMIQSDNWRTAFENRQWEFLQHTITNNIKEKLYKPSRMAIKISACIGFVFSIAKIFQYLIDHDADETPSESINHNHVFYGYAMIALSVFSVAMMHTMLEEQASREVYTEFITQWPDNKPYTPECLHILLDEFYCLYQRYGSDCKEYKDKYKQVEKIIKQALLNYFPKPIKIHNNHVILYR